MPIDRELKTTFDDVADIYDEVRPEYPEQLIEDVIVLSGIPAKGNILEIGCGSGKATLPFARRKYAMLCLELGPRLAQLAIKHCRPYPDIEIRNISFEEWPLQEKSFDLVICAEAFHWISPEVRFAKAAAALKNGGAIALFWNSHHTGKTVFFRTVERIYQQWAPQLVEHRSKPSEELEKETVREIDESGLFGKVVVRRYPWCEKYTTERYVKLLETYSPIQSLADDVRQDVLEDIRGLIELEGGTVECEYVSRLYVARVKR